MADPDDGEFVVFAAVNDDATLEQCLARSPDIACGRLKLVTIHGAETMALAYNEGLDGNPSRYAVFCHQDVYLPRGWLDRTKAALASLSESDPAWMVAGPYGIEAGGQHVGRVWDVGLGKELGVSGFSPTSVVSLDELLLILRREDGIRFDPDLPHFHLYGTDLVQTCLSLGHSAWAIEVPVVHNSQPVASLGGGYAKAYRYARRKWRARLPIPTTVCRLTNNPLTLWRARLRRWHVPRRTGTLLADAVQVAKTAGYED